MSHNTSLASARHRPARAALPALPALLMALGFALAVAWPALGANGQRMSQPAAAAATAAPDGADAARPLGLALIRLQPGPATPAAEAELRDWPGYAARGVLALLALPFAWWLLRRPRVVNPIPGPGFEVASPSERRRFIPLEERFQTLDFVGKIQTDGQLRLSANLNKVTLSARKYGYLMEDKNYRNALLVNRRRVRRTLLRDGDVLDLGDLTLLYRDNRAAPIVRYSSITPAEGKSQIKFQRLNGPIRKGMPMFVPEQTPNRIFYVTKNKVFIGRSENNDLVIKSRNVYYRHAKLERIGGRWKLQDLSILGSTFVNNRRIEQRFLKEGDEISIESHRFKFGFVTRAMRERPPHPAQASAAEESEEQAHEPLAGPEPGDGGDAADESEFAPNP
jgi:pSer/pThr/pTyr-binding forkhead associated (FHA) protein